MSDKVALRARFRGVLSSLDLGQRTLASQAIVQRILSLPDYTSATRIGLFAPHGDEVNIRPLFEGAKECYFPRVVGEHLVFFRVRRWEELAPGYRHLMEPDGCSEPLDPNRCELIVVPGLAFDRQGGRLGRGKGFYDRYLQNVEGSRVGVAFEACVAECLPMEPHDARVNVLVTETAVRRF